jgi:diguanylate cyclase (GGDEF)-like protein/PAS domain S-box-containing protein
MPKRSRTPPDWQDLQNRIIGLGEDSIKKSHYPELRKRLGELERFRSLIDLASDFLLIIDLGSGRIVDWNLAARSVLGHAAPPALAEIETGAIADFLALPQGGAGNRRSLVATFRRADGSLFPAEISISIETGGDERQAIVVGRDITERLETERRLRLASTVFDNSPDGLMVVSPDAVIATVNPAFSRITGFPAAEVVGRPAAILQPAFRNEEFIRSVWNTVRKKGHWRGEIWSARKTGEPLPLWVSVSTVRDDAGVPLEYVCAFSDITRIKESESRLEYLTHHDPLTQFPNRLTLVAALDRALLRARRSGEVVALLFIDIDRFKTINDTLGHHAGDLLLQAVATRIAGAARDADLVAHMSGDEFAVMLEGLDGAEGALREARKILLAFADPFDLDGFDAFVTLSIGVSLFPEHGQTAAALLRNCDSAVHQAKEEGGNRFRLYTRDLTKTAFKNLQIESSLRRSIESGGMEMFYQPQFRLEDDSFCGAEALVRWRHPKRGLIPPDVFIPRAEETGLIVPLGRRLLLDVCHRARSWLDKGLTVAPVAVNVSGVQIAGSPIVETVAEALSLSGLPPRLLKLEITESFAMRGTQESLDRLLALRALGIELAVDDFGTGYASLAYLRKLPVSIIKIDREFVRNVPDHRGDCAIIEAIIAMTHGLGLLVVAEGVETEGQKAFLRRAGCDVMQGFLGGRPQPAADFERAFLVPARQSLARG